MLWFTMILHKAFFRARERVHSLIIAPLLKVYWSFQGAKFGKGTSVPTQLRMTWPHQVIIGENCTLEAGIFFKFDGIWSPGPSINIGRNVFIGSNCEFNIRKNILIGNDCLIASGCKFIDHDHGIESGLLMRMQAGCEAPIVLKENVWLGVNVAVLKGVTIGEGSVVGSNAVCTKSIPPREIWAGVPAKKIGQR